MRPACPFWVFDAVLAMTATCRLSSQLRTCKCIAVSVAMGQFRKLSWLAGVCFRHCDPRKCVITRLYCRDVVGPDQLVPERNFKALGKTLEAITKQSRKAVRS